MKKTVWLLSILFLVLISSACSGLHRLAGGGRDDQKAWLENSSKQQRDAESSERTAQVERLTKIEKAEIEYNKNNPEIPVTDLGDGIPNDKNQNLKSALNGFPFVTREPGSEDPNKIYANVGDYKLTLSAMMISLREQANDCKKIAAYSGYNIKNACYDQIAIGLNDFAKVIRDGNTPDLTKKTALSEASFGGAIDFEHAARLVAMHNQLCAQQGNSGYVTMVTVAAPCRLSRK